MKIQIRRFRVTVHNVPGYDNYIVESPHPDEARSKLKFDLRLPIGTKMTAQEIKPLSVDCTMGEIQAENQKLQQLVCQNHYWITPEMSYTRCMFCGAIPPKQS